MNEDLKSLEAVTETEPAPPAPKKGKTKKGGDSETKAVMADLNTWEKPVSDGKAKEIIDHGNGITAYHY